MPNWTEQQKMVIQSGERRMICSAAAGSGKTAVMVERVVRMIREGADPEAFLVVTFTNTAAAEMKEKIRDRLRDERKYDTVRSAYEKIDIMEISTIHSFCQRLIRQEFQSVNVDPMFRICDGGMGTQLFSKAFRSACNSLLAEGDADFAEFRKRFDPAQTEEIVRQVYQFIMSLPDPLRWLEEACADIPEHIDANHPWFQTAERVVREKIRTAQTILRNQYRMFEDGERIETYRDVWKADEQLFHVKQRWADREEVTAEALNQPFRKMPSATKLTGLEEDWKERYTKYRDQLKKINEDILFFIFPDPERAEGDLANIRESLQGLRKIIVRTWEEFENNKSRMRVLDFNDLEHKALAILNRPELRESVQKQYRYIFVDECQDVSAVQDAIIQALGGTDNHLFMVGDVKQSIYRFRRADPTLFMNRKEEYLRPECDGDCLDLQTNFRSRPEILETANTVFRDIMRKDIAEIDYTRREELIAGREEEGYHPVMVDILEPKEDTPRIEALADYVTERVLELLEEGFSYKDMVILMPKVSGDGSALAEALTKRSVPVFFDGGADFYELPEVKTFLQLLETIDNDFRDLPLIAALRNAPFFFTEEELARVRLVNPGKGVPFWQAFRECAGLEEIPVGARCAEAAEKIRKWRQTAEVSGLAAFLYHLASDSLQYAVAGASPSGRTAQRNLRILCQEAVQAEGAGIYTLRDFLRYVADQAGGTDQRAAAPLADGDDVIRIMTMHKSKGLQFPVVFCIGLDRSMKGKQEGQVALDAELGITLRYKQPKHRVARKTAADRIFEWKKEHEERAERIRLLYVAMTRARERMFLAGVSEDRPDWQMPAGEHRVVSAADYLDWIVPALRDAEKLSTDCAHGQKPWKIRFFESNQQEAVENVKVIHNLSNWLNSLLSEQPVDDLWKELKPEPDEERMAKRSVTALIREAERELGPADEEKEETPEDKRTPERFSAALRKYDIGPYPAFMTPPPEKQGAWRGTLTHRFLALTDLAKIRAAGENAAEELERQLAEMRESGVFQGEEADAISIRDVAGFYASGLGQRLLRSPEVRREWNFNFLREEQHMLVQGVMDCVFLEDGEWILLDYKTDRIEDEGVFAEHYRPQLAWYAAALEALTGKKVRERWLYSLSLGKALKV